MKLINHSFIKTDSIIDNCYRDCHKKYFITFLYRCIYSIEFTNFFNNDVINLAISHGNMGLFELNENLKNARQRRFLFNEI